MEITIDDTSRLCDIQKEFSRHFPYLKLEFFGFQPEQKKIFTRKNLITDTRQTLGDVRHIHRPGHVSINGHLKVSTLEQNFRGNYGIHVQVFRKSGNIWLETTVTDDWTLSKQDRKGGEINLLSKETTEQDFDGYREQE